MSALCNVPAETRAAWYCVTAYLFSILPYAFVSRAHFLYHYLPGLLFGEILLGKLACSSCDLREWFRVQPSFVMVVLLT